MKLMNPTDDCSSHSRGNRVQAAGGSHEVLAGVLIAALLLVLLAFGLAWTVLQGVGPSRGAIDALRQTLVPEIRSDMKPEAMERWLFILLTLASPFCVLAGLRLARGFSGWVNGVMSRPRVAGGVALIAGGIGIYLLHGNTLFPYFVFPESAVVDEAIVLGGAVLLFFVTWRRGTYGFAIGEEEKVRRSYRGLGHDRACPSTTRCFLEKCGNARMTWRVVAMVIAFAVTLLPRGLGTHSILMRDTAIISPFAWEVHFQAVAYSLTQLYAGKPLLTASPPLYGYYAEFLLPVFKVTGLSVFKFCVAMGVLQGVALAAIVSVVLRHLRLPLVKLFCYAALLYFVGSTCLVGRRAFDPVFQYWPIRFVFPALSIPVYLWAARRGKASGWVALGIFSGLALMWNLESGIAVAGAVLFTLGVEAIGAWRAKRAGEKRHGLFVALLIVALLIVAGAMVVTGAVFWLGLEMQTGWRAPMHETSEYQRLFYESGLMMEPMPLAAHPWWLVIATYLLGLGFGLHGLLGGRLGRPYRAGEILGASVPGALPQTVVGRPVGAGNDASLKCMTDTRFARLALFLSILGTGLFTYYQGRSVDFNLMNASWPALLLGFLMVDRLLRAIRARMLPRGMGWVALPAAYLGLMAVVMMPGAVARCWSFGKGQWGAELSSQVEKKTDRIDRRVAFIRDHVGADRDCVILADYQAAYFMETGLRSSLDAPG
ncbi:MAG: hypothetical protein WCD79_00050, partial [Chthoniobacteraceae bacterium]